MKRDSAYAPQAEPDHRPVRVRLPAFITDEDVGFGVAMTRATSYVGIKPCGGCERRAAALDRWLVFSGKREM